MKTHMTPLLFKIENFFNNKIRFFSLQYSRIKIILYHAKSLPPSVSHDKCIYICERLNNLYPFLLMLM